MSTKKPTAPRAEYAAKPVTPLINEFCDWIEREVGVKLDADARRAVYLGSALRTEFQKANRSEKQAALDSITVPAKRAPRKAAAAKLGKALVDAGVNEAISEIAAEVVKRAPRTLKGSTVATADGVVVAEQRHVEVG